MTNGALAGGNNEGAVQGAFLSDLLDRVRALEQFKEGREVQLSQQVRPKREREGEGSRERERERGGRAGTGIRRWLQDS
jgi:hypothetical protein